jgi:hypothetical protein
MVTIYMSHGAAKKQIIDKRMAVDSDWVKLWYTLLEGKFDQALWDRLGDREKLFMVRAFRSSGIPNDSAGSHELEIAHARDQKRDMDRLATLEGEIVAGNVSQKIAKEYNDIVDQLGYTYDLDPRYTSQLKTRMRNSLSAALKK